MTYLANAVYILIEFIFGILTTLVVLRVLLQAVHANFYNPICQLIYKTTNPIFTPVRRIIPSWRSLDVAGILLTYALILMKSLIIFWMSGIQFGFMHLVIFGMAKLMEFVLMLMLWVIIIRTFLCFVDVDRSNAFSPLVHQLSEPVLYPIRLRLPLLSGFDFSPMVAILAISLLRVLLIQPLLDLASHVR